MNLLETVFTWYPMLKEKKRIPYYNVFSKDIAANTIDTITLSIGARDKVAFFAIDLKATSSDLELRFSVPSQQIIYGDAFVAADNFMRNKNDKYNIHYNPASGNLQHHNISEVNSSGVDSKLTVPIVNENLFVETIQHNEQPLPIPFGVILLQESDTLQIELKNKSAIANSINITFFGVRFF